MAGSLKFARGLSRALLAGLLLATGAGCGQGPGSRNDVVALDAGEGGAGVADAGSEPDSASSDHDIGEEPDAASDVTSTGADAASEASRFVTGVVSFDPGPCAGFGQNEMPGVVEGPPVGGGTGHGSTDVVSLGNGGSIVVSFAPNAIVDGPGPDFIVFENAFWVGGNANDIYAEPGEVSVSDDGTTWTTFPCTPTLDPQSSHGTGVAPPYGMCAGWQVVYSAPGNGISPLDPSVAGGLALDLATVGVTHARYVRIVDKTSEACPEAGPDPNTNGFDLDAIAIVNGALP